MLIQYVRTFHVQEDLLFQKMFTFKHFANRYIAVFLLYLFAYKMLRLSIAVEQTMAKQWLKSHTHFFACSCPIWAGLASIPCGFCWGWKVPHDFFPHVYGEGISGIFLHVAFPHGFLGPPRTTPPHEPCIIRRGRRKKFGFSVLFFII